MASKQGKNTEIQATKDKDEKSNQSESRTKRIEDRKRRQGDYEHVYAYSYPVLRTWQPAAYQVGQLQETFNSVKDSSNHEELLKYVVINSIATLETFFKGVISQIIDSGLPYLEQVKNLRNIGFDVDEVLVIPQKRISVGEFVSEQLRYSKLDAILETIGVLTQQNFRDSLKAVTDSESKELILEDADKTFENIRQMFGVRHIVAHEMTLDIRSKTAVIEEGLKSILDVINATGEFVANLLNMPVTIDEKVKYAEYKLAALQEELKSLTEEFRHKLKSDGVLEMMLENFENEQVTWTTLIGQQRFEGYLIGGTGGVKGHGNDLASLDAETYLTQVRVNSLKFRLSGDRSYRQ